MTTKPSERTFLIKWIGNNSPRYDNRIFWRDVGSIVSVNGRDVSALSSSDLIPGDAVVVQHTSKRNKPGRRLWKAVVMSEDTEVEATFSQADRAARASPSSSSQGSKPDSQSQRTLRK